MAKNLTKFISFRHSQNIGDIIYSLSGIESVCRKNNAKADLFYWLNRPAFYYESAVHPIMDDGTGKTNVMLNFKMLDMLTPLLEAQSFVNSVNVWNGEPIEIDLDKVRQVNINVPHGCIRKWYSYLYPDMCHDNSKQIIHMPKNLKHRSLVQPPYVLVNRTQRYLSHYIAYKFLKDYPNVLFAGTEVEYKLFLTHAPNAIHIQVRDFLDLAYWIQNAQVFIGNQSFCFAVAEQMKTKRVLEVCAYAQNVIPSGANGYDFYSQEALEYYVAKLWNNQQP